MHPTIAIVAPGNMGAGIGARLADHGATVLNSLEGRSQASAQRAQEAGMRAATDTELVQADVFLSVVPPGDALALAQRFAPALQGASRKPLYVDCNAVSPQTVGRIAAVVTHTGCPFADGGIIGMPPRRGESGGARLYVSGPDTARAAALADYGLLVRVLDGLVGDASALKLCYASTTKGLTALGGLAADAATRAGVADALRSELTQSQPALAGFLDRSVPAAFSKAYRWVAEMQEIDAFLSAEGGPTPFAAIAGFYQALAEDAATEQGQAAHLRRFFAPPTQG